MPTKTKGESESNAWVETRRMWPDDIRLRRAGFQIHARPNKGEALWRFGGVVLTESEALASLQTAE